MADRASTPAVAGGLMLAGAGIVIASIFLEWFAITEGGATYSYNGADFATGGGIALFAGIAGAFAVVMLARARKTGGRAWSITALVFGCFVFLLTSVSAFVPESAIPEFAAEQVSEAQGVSQTQAKALIEEKFRTGEANATSGVGAYLGFAGGALLVAGAIIGISSAGRFKTSLAPSPMAPMPPPSGGLPPVPPMPPGP